MSAVRNWNRDDAFKHSAAVSFYTLFSLAPVTIIAVAIAGAFFGPEVASRQFSAQMAQLIGPRSAEMIQSAVASSQPKNEGWTSTVISLAVLAVGATTVFAQLQSALNAIWGVKAKPSRSGFLVLLFQRLISFAMVVTVGFLLLVSLVLTTALTAFVQVIDRRIAIPPVIMQGADLIIALGVITTLFALVFKIMPDAETRWRDVWRGAFVGALLFSAGRLLIAFYLSRSDIASVYGGAGSLVALLIWIYYSCAILFFGAEFALAHAAKEGVKIRPSKTAVHFRQEIVEGGP